MAWDIDDLVGDEIGRFHRECRSREADASPPCRAFDQAAALASIPVKNAPDAAPRPEPRRLLQPFKLKLKRAFNL